MNKTEIPKAIHHSHQFQQMDLGETIWLYAGEEPGHETILGEIYNADNFPCEDAEAAAKAFADKIVRAYNCHDDLLDALKRIVPPTCPIVTHHRPDCDLCRGLRAIAKATKGEPDAETV